jgi:2-oxoglutarate ferredoxin oxidoreductase subunit beta
VWVVTGDGDGLASGTSHLLHALRRNVDIKVLLFNNEVFGLTRGQCSPTTRPGTRTMSSPGGSFEGPLRALSMALASEATFVARTLDVDVGHLGQVLERAAAHKGAAFVEILQNCKVFNDGVFEYAIDKGTKADAIINLEHGRPLIFGQDRNRGLRLNGFEPEAVQVGNGVTIDDLIIHDEKAPEPTQAFLLSRLAGPDYPECLGVFRCVQRPTFDEQVGQRSRRRGRDLRALLTGDDSWVVA